ncbi:TonB-dependent receptor [Parasphingopyxis algicola]|uniref:TonB-dependent receptor n=1 Tax=Parasphingopyxis algicola TaxID=2026624 RepID=UPI0015A13E50|nr:TonB-dependent receptor [Parasphingopyxis algicola]QLC24259.1 TonB-dependent receptor [Parasphingopyxis algicola]
MTYRHSLSAKAVLAASVAFLSVPAIAQDASEQPSGDDFHGDASAQIVVTASFVDELDLLAGTSTLSGTDLDQAIRPQIGDVLTALPGVSATSFTPGASRPVLRGFQGERIRVLTDGIGAIDASNTSADHAVTIDPITAYRIEVLRGPAALLFGSQAIGGAVNVFDRRIPREIPDEPIHIDAVTSYGSAADEWSIAGGVDLPLTSNLVLHVDGSYRDSDDLDISGFALSPALRAEQLEIAAEETEEGNLGEAEEALELANLRGTIPNSAVETLTGGAGLALIEEWGNIGVSVSYFGSDYGIPARPGAEHAHEEGEEEGEEEEEEEGPVTIDLEQIRADLRGEIRVANGFLDSIRIRLGYSDYTHTEFEGDEVGTRFFVDGFEGRLEFVQRAQGSWRGVIGTQLYVRDFDAIGAEAFVPENNTEQVGLFTLQEFDVGALHVEVAGRYEHTNVSSGPVGVDRSFNAFSGAIGANVDVAPGVIIGANFSRAERAPSAEELFSNGPHIATQAFEIGNPNFDTEKSIGLEGYIRGEAGGVNFALTGYVSWFDDFIFDTATGEEEDDLPVFQYFQRDATYYGFEAEISATLAEVGEFRINADAVADYVRASIENGGGPVPRIPPLRLLGGLEAQSDNFDARAEVEWVAEQDRVAAFETTTDDFTLVNASIAWRPWGRANGTSLFASVNNLFDVNARRHASFTKDFVPLAGRDFRFGARFSF